MTRNPDGCVTFAAIGGAAWLTPDRAKAWGRVMATFTVLSLVALLATTRFGTVADPWHRPLGTDFVSFWTAGQMALGGQAPLAWDAAAHGAAENLHFPVTDGFRATYYAFFYPPPFLLLCLPLALLPYNAALLTWLSVTGAACYAAVRRLLPAHWPSAMVFLAFPALLLNAEHGQNGAFTAALMAGAAVTIERRPAVAGLLLAGLCVKPQLALLLVPTLLAARRWRTLLVLVLSVIGLSAASLIAFGVEAWAAFMTALPNATATMEFGLVGFGKMVSPFAALRLAGLGLGAAWTGQMVVTVTVIALIVATASRRPGARTETVLFVSGALLATPFLLDYDLMALAVPLAWIVSQAERGSFLPWEKPVLALAFALPLFARILAIGTNIPVAPLVLAAVFALVLRRAYATRRPLANSSGISGSVDASDTKAQ